MRPTWYSLIRYEIFTFFINNAQKLSFIADFLKNGVSYIVPCAASQMWAMFFMFYKTAPDSCTFHYSHPNPRDGKHWKKFKPKHLEKLTPKVHGNPVLHFTKILKSSNKGHSVCIWSNKLKFTKTIRNLFHT